MSRFDPEHPVLYNVPRLVEYNDPTSKDWCVCGHNKFKHDKDGVCLSMRRGKCGCEMFVPRREIQMAEWDEEVAEGEIKSPEELADRAKITLAEARFRFSRFEGLAEEEIKARRVQYTMTVIPYLSSVVSDTSKPNRLRMRCERILAQRLGFAQGKGIAININNTNNQQTNVAVGSFDEWVRKRGEEP